MNLQFLLVFPFFFLPMPRVTRMARWLAVCQDPSLFCVNPHHPPKKYVDDDDDDKLDLYTVKISV